MNSPKTPVLRAWSAARVAVLLCALSTTGYAGASGVKVSPGSISFGNNAVGAASAARTVIVTNSSRQKVEIRSVSLSSLEFAYSGPVLPVTLGPGQSFSGTVLFLPTAALTYTARLTFHESRMSTTVQLSGTGTAAPALSSSAPVAPPSVPTPKVTPTITWATPAAISYGTALSAAQLDASASTAGSFAYSPVPGTVLSAGSQTLSVTFTPADTTDYNTATGSVVLTVNSAAPASGSLTVTPASVTFGRVSVGTSSSQIVTLTNSGNASVTISNLSISGPGVGASGVSAGIVLTGGQSASLDLTFAASSAGSVTGGVTLVSNASNSSLTIPVSASGVNPSVSLSWAADSSATGGYDVYSSTVSGGPYNLLTPTPVTMPAYTDNTVQAGLTYYYVVTALDATTNTQSGYSNEVSVVIP